VEERDCERESRSVFGKTLDGKHRLAQALFGTAPSSVVECGRFSRFLADVICRAKTYVSTRGAPE